MGIFASALAEMTGHQWRPPQEFKEYCEQHQLPGVRTQAAISVQSYSGLDAELRDAGVMVFRLGSPAGRARFGLVRAQGALEREFFLQDHDCFCLNAPPTTFVSEAGMSDLYPFQLLGSIQEGSAVNLAIASGLLGHALGLDEPDRRIAPATGASSYTFPFRPHPALDLEWTHVSGQVEIDTLFLARRRNHWALFIVEAKHGPPGSGLAKHKLAYPAYVLNSKPLPKDIPVVPVYLRSWHEGDYVYFGVAECTFGDCATKAVAALQVRSPAPVLALPVAVLR